MGVLAVKETAAAKRERLKQMNIETNTTRVSK